MRYRLVSEELMKFIAYSAQNTPLTGGPEPRPLYAGTPESRALREEFLNAAGDLNQRIADDPSIDPFAMRQFMSQLGRSLTRYDFEDFPADAEAWAAGASVLFLDEHGELYDVHRRKVLSGEAPAAILNARALDRAQSIRNTLSKQGFLVDSTAIPVPDVAEMLLPAASDVVDRVICLAVLVDSARELWRGKNPDMQAIADRYDLALVTLTDSEQRLFELFARIAPLDKEQRQSGMAAVAEVLDQAVVVETLAWCVGLLGDDDIPADRIGTAHAHPINLVNPKALFVPKRLLSRSLEELYQTASYRTLEEICVAHEYVSSLDRLALAQREALADGESIAGELLQEAQVATVRMRALAFAWLTLPYASWDELVDRSNRLA
ncbi:Hypothetical protein CpMEX9_2140 [Corynebacterium pseudotuberculosis]|nr:Hypothetical protein CpPAT10_2080 [Corynebacterium pseudotuberculosis PAT10]AEP71295.1 Hypothetical protein Cp4202_2068 [Corynebacterium pseudotuberculosis 42/02-A]AFF23218.1 Hypothetical protein CpP54B96_2111 [Corynebacterium pseudotuberculosis P54B96]AKC74853.1 Hypothetical protein Cp226_2171 [Corynebacterium pseudotuberculosis]ANH26869.1 Hypothetical protein CpMEX9_2140 [Corynebacterium pseudotuberculosis]